MSMVQKLPKKKLQRQEPPMVMVQSLQRREIPPQERQSRGSVELDKLLHGKKKQKFRIQNIKIHLKSEATLPQIMKRSINSALMSARRFRRDSAVSPAESGILFASPPPHRTRDGRD